MALLALIVQYFLLNHFSKTLSCSILHRSKVLLTVLSLIAEVIECSCVHKVGLIAASVHRRTAGRLECPSRLHLGQISYAPIRHTKFHLPPQE